MPGREGVGQDESEKSLAEKIPAGRLASLDIRFMAALPDCIMLIDLAGNVAFLNGSGCTLLDIDDFDTVIGKPWRNLWPDDARHVVEGAFNEALDRKVARFSAASQTAKGVLKQWDVIVSPVMGETDQIEWLLAISRDVTPERQAAKLLELREQELRALADNIAPFTWMADPNGSIYWYNKRWYDYTGTTLGEVAGWNWVKVHHPDHVDRVLAKIKRCFEVGEDWEDTFPLRAKDGTYRWFLSRAMPVRDDTGAIVLWCGTNTDITEQRSIDARLAQKARLIDLSHEAILVWEMGGNIVSWNAGCVELYGFTASEAIGQRNHDLLRTSLAAGPAAFDAQLRLKRKWTGEVLHRAKDGSEVWVDSRQETMEFGDREIVLEVNRDITERKRSDEIRSLLIGELDHRVKNTLAIVQSIARQTARSTRDLTEFTSKFDDRLQSLAGAHHVLTESNWSGARIRDIISSQLFEASSPERRVVLTGPNPMLSAQPALQLSLILHELAANARKYGALSGSDGRVEISWEKLAGDPPRVAILWCEIGGPPVPANVRPGFGTRLIERAGSQDQLRAKLTFSPQGVVCEIEAELAKSPATITYFNPGAPVATSLARAKPANTSLTRAPTARVLIIEDEPLIGMEIEQIVERAGYQPVGPTMSVDQALAAIDEGGFELALVDGSLHGAPVDAIVTALAEKSIPFAFVTGFTKHALPTTAVDVPIVSKPIDPKKLTDVVENLAAAAKTSRG